MKILPGSILYGYCWVNGHKLHHQMCLYYEDSEVLRFIKGVVFRAFDFYLQFLCMNHIQDYTHFWIFKLLWDLQIQITPNIICISGVGGTVSTKFTICKLEELLVKFYLVIVPLWSILKYSLSHEWLVTESSKQRTHSISDRRIVIMLCIWGLSRNLFCIQKNIPTVVGIMQRGNTCKCGVYAQLIVTDIHIYNKTGWGLICFRLSEVLFLRRHRLDQFLNIFQ